MIELMVLFIFILGNHSMIDLDTTIGAAAMQHDLQSRISVLHLAHNVSETTSSYNEHILPNIEKYDLALCTIFDQVVPNTPSALRLYVGNNSTLGFITLLSTLLRSGHFDVIHAHTPHTAVLLVIASIWALRLDLLRSSVLTVHSSIRIYKTRNQILAFLAFLFIGHIVHCSKSSYDSLPWLFKVVSDYKRTYIQNGVDLERIDRTLANARSLLAESMPHESDVFTVVSVGRLIHIKNPLTLLKGYTLSQIEHAKLIFIGQGDLLTSLEHEIDILDRDHNVELAGLISREDVFGSLRTADLFVSTSYGEGLPYSVMEAMACQCPVILSDIGPHREIAQGADFIPIIEPDDVQALAREIHKFSSMSAAERVKIGKRCRQWVAQYFSLSSMNQQYAELYQKISKKQVMS